MIDEHKVRRASGIRTLMTCVNVWHDAADPRIDNSMQVMDAVDFEVKRLGMVQGAWEAIRMGIGELQEHRSFSAAYVLDGRVDRRRGTVFLEQARG